MSTFLGRMKEYTDISIDRFNEENMESTVYFLSHNHTDHTVGLSAPVFRLRLESCQHIKLYCSEVTRQLLLTHSAHALLHKSLIALPLNETSVINVPYAETGLIQAMLRGLDQSNALGSVKHKVNVTLISAGHCPGSVMFLFEGAEGVSLYTGDFRLECADISRIESLKSGSSPKVINSLYIDTTFCTPNAFFIPSRDGSTNRILHLAAEWLACDTRNVILLKYSANLGYEDLFRRLADRFHMKVHVTEERYAEYKEVADMSEFTTNDHYATRIHAYVKQPRYRERLPSVFCARHLLAIRTITVSAMAFTQDFHDDCYVKRRSDHHFHVCYSLHSSYSELRGLMEYLKPHRAFANVIPRAETQKQIDDRLEQIRRLSTKSPKAHSQPRKLGRLKRKKRWRRPLSQPLDDSQEFDFGDSETMPKKRKLVYSEQRSTPNVHGSVNGGEANTEICIEQLENESNSTHSSYDDKSDDELFPSSSDEKEFTPAKGGSYGKYVFYVSELDNDDDDDDDEGDEEDRSSTKHVEHTATIGSDLAMVSSIGPGAVEMPASSCEQTHDSVSSIIPDAVEMPASGCGQTHDSVSSIIPDAVEMPASGCEQTHDSVASIIPDTVEMPASGCEQTHDSVASIIPDTVEIPASGCEQTHDSASSIIPDTIRMPANGCEQTRDSAEQRFHTTTFDSGVVNGEMDCIENADTVILRQTAQNQGETSANSAMNGDHILDSDATLTDDDGLNTAAMVVNETDAHKVCIDLTQCQSQERDTLDLRRSKSHDECIDLTGDSQESLLTVVSLVSNPANSCDVNEHIHESSVVNSELGCTINADTVILRQTSDNQGESPANSAMNGDTFDSDATLTDDDGDDTGYYADCDTDSNSTVDGNNDSHSCYSPLRRENLMARNAGNLLQAARAMNIQHR